MKKKKVIGIIIVVVLFLVALLTIIFLYNNDKKATYKIVVSVIEKNSPDRELSVFKNQKEINFDTIYYLDDVLLCKGVNPTINKNDVKNGEELKIKLKNKKIVRAIVEMEEE